MNADWVRQMERRVKALEALVLSEGYITFSNQNATPSVGGGRRFKTANTGATTITDLHEGKVGQDVVIIFGDANTTIDFTGTNLDGNGGVNWSPGAGDFMRCVKNSDDTWKCQVTEI